jgi:hypothetical protein
MTAKIVQIVGGEGWMHAIRIMISMEIWWWFRSKAGLSPVRRKVQVKTKNTPLSNDPRFVLGTAFCVWYRVLCLVPIRQRDFMGQCEYKLSDEVCQLFLASWHSCGPLCLKACHGSGANIRFDGRIYQAVGLLLYR